MNRKIVQLEKRQKPRKEEDDDDVSTSSVDLETSKPFPVAGATWHYLIVSSYLACGLARRQDEKDYDV